jgi:hypothetical protein
MSFRFIRDHADRWPIRLMCRVLEVSASGYYAWRSRPESSRAASNRTLLADVRRLHAEHRGRYGSPRMHAAPRGRQDGKPWPHRAADAASRYPRARRSSVQAVYD